MRALILALLLLASPSYAGETILSGDSDHTYLPVQSDREVLLHEFTYLATSTSNPATYNTWAATWNTNCIQQYGEQGNVNMSEFNRGCSLAANAFRAARPFSVTRVMIYIPDSSFAVDPQFALEARVARVATDGTLTVIGQPVALQTPGFVAFNLNNGIAIGQGVGIQYRWSGASVGIQDFGTHPQVQIWGIWK